MEEKIAGIQRRHGRSTLDTRTDVQFKISTIRLPPEHRMAGSHLKVLDNIEVPSPFRTAFLEIHYTSYITTGLAFVQYLVTLLY